MSIMGRITDMTTGSPAKHILRFAFPLIVTNLGQQFYMIVDASIVGRGVGVKALAAVGATDWIYWLILWTILGVTQGFSSFVSRDFGDRNYRSMNKTIGTSVVLCTLSAAILTVAGIVAAKPLLLLLNTPADIMDGAITYLLTMICGTFAVMAYNAAAALLRALGDGKTPLVAMVIAALLNIGLDLLFVFVFHLGIFGAALASVLSQCVAFLYCLAHLRRVECIKLCKEDFRLDFSLTKRMILFIIPIALQYIMISVGGIVLQSSINMQGSVFIAGYTATNKVYGLLESSSISLGLACATFLAQNYGARNYARVKKGVLCGSVIVSIMAIVVMGVTLLVREPLLQLFLDVNEAGGNDALQIAAHYLSILVICLVVLYLIHIFRNALQAMGISSWLFVSGSAELVARIFMSKVAIYWLGSDALFIAEPIAWAGALLAVLLPYFWYRKKLLSDRSAD